MIETVQMYQLDLGAVFARVRGRGCDDLKIVYISKFSQLRSLGGEGVIKFLLLPKFKKVHIILGRVKKIMDFLHFLGYFQFGILPLVSSIEHYSLFVARMVSALYSLSALLSAFSLGTAQSCS